ncbi:MAG TPA: phage baseplate assembly protein V [Panacibacter sp.]|nr:phage baseplate assembly protein V [Panacibacter sp.]
MAQEIQVDITTENGLNITPFSNLTVTQQFNGHHYFELRFNHDVIEKKNTVLLDKTKDFLGKTITFTFKAKQGSDYPDNIFKAIVTDIGIANHIGGAGDIIFKGYSPTILLEGGQNNVSYTQLNLLQIVKGAIGNIPGNLLSTKISPNFKATIPYIVQYKETSFDFIRRLAAEYGEWFFYDGTTFNFGKPGNKPSVEFKYPRDISDLNLNVKVAPVKFNQIEYYSKNDDKFSSNSNAAQVSGLDVFGDYALKASDKLFTEAVILFSEKKVISKSELDDVVKFEKSSRAGDMVYLTAVSDSPYVKLGATVNISATRQDNHTDEDFGKFLVINVTHSTDGLGNYNNSFQAIPSTVEIIPNPYDKPPLAEPQIAVVKQNNDPDHLGRVKVQLMWQKESDTTPWLRVMSMHAGTKTGGDKNRGLFFTPEVGDYVIVGFTQNDPNRPFVMGSVPHGKAIDSSKNSDNHIKAIRTRSGSTIYFKDKENSKEQEIIVKTDDQNMISILLQNNKGTIKIISSKDIEVTSDSEVKVKSKKITIDASDELNLKAQKINIEAGQELKAKGMQVNIEGSTSTKIKSSAQLDIDGGAMANIKAAIVKIN